MNNKLEELYKSKREIEENISKEEHKYKSKRGTLKEGEWFLLKIIELDENDNPSENISNIIFFRSCQGCICMNGYIDWYSDYIFDLTNSAPYYEKWTGNKISKEEAFKYL